MGRALGGDAVAHKAAGVVKAGERLGVAFVRVADVFGRAVRAEDHHAAAGLGHVEIVGVGRQPQHARDTGAGRVAVLDFGRVVGVGEVDIRGGGPVRVHGDAEQAAVGRVVDLVGEVDKRVGQQLAVLGHAHVAALFGDEDAAVGRHGEAGGPVKAEHHRFLDKAVGHIEAALCVRCPGSVGGSSANSSASSRNARGIARSVGVVASH